MTDVFVTAIAVLLRILSNPLANVVQKKLTAGGLHPLLINFLSYFLLSVVCCLLVFRIQSMPLPPLFWVYSILAGIVGAVGNGLLVKALQSGDLSVLGPINAYKSIVGMVAGVVLLGEWPNAWGLLGMALIIWGSYFVLDTTEERFTWALFGRKSIQYRLGALLLTAVEAVFTKKIILLSSTPVAFISWCWGGSFFSFLFLVFAKPELHGELKKFTARHAITLLALAACIGITQFSTTYAFEHMSVGYALALFQLSAIVSVVLGYYIFNEQDIRKKLIGSVIMILGSVIIILLK